MNRRQFLATTTSAAAAYQLSAADAPPAAASPVIGGSGAYAGATGWVDSTHNADGTWTHIFHIR